MAKTCLTVRMIIRIEVCFFIASHSDPMILKGKVIAQQIKVTLGITGLYFSKVPIEKSVWHLDVG